MKKLMHKDISFYDPTSKYIFGSIKVIGKDEVFKNFVGNYSAIIDFKKSNLESFFSSNTGVFKFNLSWKFKEADNKVVTIKDMPLVVVLTVENNKVISHVDYGDYTYFVKQIKKLDQ
ncbi:nuclear transport factor 2 family protein [Corallibacter sp.]|uniref:nuclear transport factor 2 family protein n=1 Tax=Corallibacter sp. TaxID=2038084 RepID=UPI003AB86CF4